MVLERHFMKRKRHRTDELIRKLREVESRVAAGETLASICTVIGVSQVTLGRWRAKYRSMDEGEIRRMRSMEEELRRLRRAVADLTLDNQILKEINEGKY